MIRLSTLLFMYPNICYVVNSHPLLLSVYFGVCTLGVQILRMRSFSFVGRLEGGNGDILL